MIFVKTKGKNTKNGSYKITELIKPNQNDRQVGQLNGFFSFRSLKI